MLFENHAFVVVTDKFYRYQGPFAVEYLLCGGGAFPFQGAHYVVADVDRIVVRRKYAWSVIRIVVSIPFYEQPFPFSFPADYFTKDGDDRRQFCVACHFANRSADDFFEIMHTGVAGEFFVVKFEDGVQVISIVVDLLVNVPFCRPLYRDNRHRS